MVLLVTVLGWSITLLQKLLLPSISWDKITTTFPCHALRPRLLRNWGSHHVQMLQLLARPVCSPTFGVFIVKEAGWPHPATSTGQAIGVSSTYGPHQSS